MDIHMVDTLMDILTDHRMDTLIHMAILHTQI